MASAPKLPENVELLAGAARELEKIFKKDLPSFERIMQDIARLGLGTLPPQGRKKLRSISAFQFDSGRFRVVYSTEEDRFLILAVFTKSDQKRRFKGWA